MGGYIHVKVSMSFTLSVCVPIATSKVPNIKNRMYRTKYQSAKTSQSWDTVLKHVQPFAMRAIECP